MDEPVDREGYEKLSGSLRWDAYQKQVIEIDRLKGELQRYRHIVGVLQHSIEMTHLTSTTIEEHVRIHNGRLEVWSLGEWYDVEKEQAEYAEAVGVDP